MGMGFFVFFGDMSKAELEKELEKVTEQRAKLDKDIVDIKVALALKEHESNNEG